MGCLKGESEVKKKGAKFACGKCGARVEKKSHACKPEKLKGAEGKKEQGRGEKETGKKKD